MPKGEDDIVVLLENSSSSSSSSMENVSSCRNSISIISGGKMLHQVEEGQDRDDDEPGPPKMIRKQVSTAEMERRRKNQEDESMLRQFSVPETNMRKKSVTFNEAAKKSLVKDGVVMSLKRTLSTMSMGLVGNSNYEVLFYHCHRHDSYCCVKLSRKQAYFSM